MITIIQHLNRFDLTLFKKLNKIPAKVLLQILEKEAKGVICRILFSIINRNI